MILKLSKISKTQIIHVRSLNRIEGCNRTWNNSSGRSEDIIIFDFVLVCKLEGMKSGHGWQGSPEYQVSKHVAFSNDR